MSRVGFSCAIVLIAAIAASGAAYAQTPAPAPKSTAVPADLDAKIKRSVKERAEKRKQVAAKRAECNKQAKAQKLGALKRRTFVRKCMAG
jgi:Skp family chaperone for outer membrane proteins